MGQCNSICGCESADTYETQAPPPLQEPRYIYGPTLGPNDSFDQGALRSDRSSTFRKSLRSLRSIQSNQNLEALNGACTILIE